MKGILTSRITLIPAGLLMVAAMFIPPAVNSFVSHAARATHTTISFPAISSRCILSYSNPFSCSSLRQSILMIDTRREDNV